MFLRKDGRRPVAGLHDLVDTYAEGKAGHIVQRDVRRKRRHLDRRVHTLPELAKFPAVIDRNRVVADNEDGIPCRDRQLLEGRYTVWTHP